MTLSSKDDPLFRPVYDLNARMPETDYRRVISSSSSGLSTFLSAPGLEHSLSAQLAGQFNVNTHAYDRAIDAVYNATRAGGSALHHNLDGSHTWQGALQALQKEFPEESELTRAWQAADHLSRDLTTPSGINPLLTPLDFAGAKHYLTDDLGLSAASANDLLNLNAVELCAGAVAAVGVVLEWESQQVDRIAAEASRLTAAGFVAGNPLCILLGTLCFCGATYLVSSKGRAGALADGTIQGALTASAYFTAAAAAGGTVFLGPLAGAAAAALVGWAYRGVRGDLFEDLDSVFERLFAGYRSYYADI
jgi:hypothetical protein